MAVKWLWWRLTGQLKYAVDVIWAGGINFMSPLTREEAFDRAASWAMRPGSTVKVYAFHRHAAKLIAIWGEDE